MAHKLHIFLCSRYRRETEAIKKEESWPDTEFHYFPAVCAGGTKRVAWTKEVINGFLSQGDGVCLIATPACGIPDGLDGRAGFTVHRLDQCFQLVAGERFLSHLLAQGAYLMTPGWLSRWRKHVDLWGFPGSGAGSFLKESLRKLVLLDTGVDERSGEQLRSLQDFTDLPGETVPVGLDFFRLFLSVEVLRWRDGHAARENEKDAAVVEQRLAEHGMILDLVKDLSGGKTEDEIIEQSFDLLGNLFAADRCVYLPVSDGVVGTERSRPARAEQPWKTAQYFESMRGDCEKTEGNDGFRFKVRFRGQVVGFFECAGFSLVERLNDYLDLVAVLENVLGLAISHVRALDRLRTISFRDPLTKLFNRRGFLEVAEKQKAFARRTGKRLLVFFCDLDGMKTINDTFGHDEGDRALQAVAWIFRRTFRASDVMARFGGDEFVTLAIEDDKDTLNILTRRLEERIRNYNRRRKNDAAISLSTGTARCSCERSVPMEALLHRADQAMYRQKRRKHSAARL